VGGLFNECVKGSGSRERIEEGGVGVESWKMNEVRKVIW
jgi:hypothetical protein